MNTKRRSSEEGIMLVELMIAAGVLVVALVMVMGSLLSVWQVVAISGQRIDASSEVTTILEEVQSLTFEELLSYDAAPLNGSLTTKYVELAMLTAEGEEILLPISEQEIDLETLPNPVEVKVTVSIHNHRTAPIARAASTLVRR